MLRTVLAERGRGYAAFMNALGLGVVGFSRRIAGRRTRESLVDLQGEKGAKPILAAREAPTASWRARDESKLTSGL